MERTTQRTMTLKALQGVGERGLPSDWFYSKGIKRGAARIHDLKKVGYIIDSERQGSGCRYFLRPNEQLSLGVDK